MEISIQMYSLHLQEHSTPMFESYEVEYCDISDSKIQIILSEFIYCKLDWMLMCLAAHSDYAPLFPTPFVIKPMRASIYLINAFTPMVLFCGSLGRNLLASVNPALL